MKRTLLLVLTLSFVLSLAFAQEMQYAPEKKALPSPGKGHIYQPNRTAPAYTFTKVPTSVIVNYYDYMIGSYNGLPLRVIPPSAGGGYFMTYHGQRQANSQRRAFYSYIDAAGNIVNNNEISSVQNREGYPTVAVDPVSGKPMYAWHANADTDAALEVQTTSDAFIVGIAGLFNDLQVPVNNPITITPPVGATTSDNEFIWPTLQIGPSPIAGKRRAYMVQRNSVAQAAHGTAGPSENPYIVYADFNGDDIEAGIPLVWNSTTIPEMNNWNVDAAVWRRPFHSLTSDDAGNLYYVGYHFAYDSDDVSLREADLDVFKCDNYGQGTWTRISDYSHIPTWNPMGSLGGTNGYFVDSDQIGYPDSLMVWSIVNSSHLNASVDNLGRLHALGNWSVSTKEGGYWADFQLVKEFVFDPATQEFAINEVYPQKNPADTFNQAFTPWDVEAPWGTPEYYPGTGGSFLNPVEFWPFPHWDEAAHADAMFFHYSNHKISDANDQGMMVAVWQDAMRARMANYYTDPEYAAFANTPEIYISVSPNNGDSWSEPIILNNVENPEFSGIKPMWVYPADQVIYVSTTPNNEKVGKIGIMFYDDYTWGSGAIADPYHPTQDGGRTMFTELQITFPNFLGASDNTVTPVSNMLHQNYPNPFNPETTISFDMPQAGNANLSIFNVKGQLVKTLVNGNLGYGRQSIVWNGTDSNNSPVTSGLYFYRLSTNGSVETRKMMLVK